MFPFLIHFLFGFGVRDWAGIDWKGEGSSLVETTGWYGFERGNLGYRGEENCAGKRQGKKKGGRLVTGIMKKTKRC